MTETADYDYELPKEQIAQHPLARRDDARLLVVDRRRQIWEHAHVRDIGQWLRPGDALVVNDTRVMPARIVGERLETGGRFEGLFLRVGDDGLWRLLAKSRGRLMPGEKVHLLGLTNADDLDLQLLDKDESGIWRARPLVPGEPFELLERIGRVPLPHYIRHGQMTDADRKRYQTVYAKHLGSAAAPTAGLHFTPELLGALKEAGVDLCSLTLHVGLGTFRPIGAERLDEHVMHSEWGELSVETAERLLAARAKGRRIVSVGTTSVRVLESTAQAHGGQLAAWSGETNLFIRPPYKFQAVDALLTNFHLPRSTLLVLVRTFGGDELIQDAYAEAIRQDYRFYSYGDAMLIV